MRVLNNHTIHNKTPVSAISFFHTTYIPTSCRRPAATIFLHPLQVDNIFVFIRQVAPISACWLFKTSVTIWLLTFDLETGIRVTCDVGYLYLCANFSLPRPLCSRVRPDVRNRQTSDRQTDRHQTKHRLIPPPYGGGGMINKMVHGACASSFVRWVTSFNHRSRIYVVTYKIQSQSSHCHDDVVSCYHQSMYRISSVDLANTEIREIETIWCATPKQ